MTLIGHHGNESSQAAAAAASADDEFAAAASAVDAYRHGFVVRRLERLVEAMQHPDSGVPFKAQKAFLSTVPAAVSGNDLIAWVRERTEAAEPGEAVHIAGLLSVYGYVYPLVEGHSLLVKDDAASMYRFQSPYFWLSISGRPDNVDYAIYLTKRMIRSKQKSGFEDYEKASLAKLQKLLADRWQFIALQAEEELKLSRERKKNDRMVLDMQEHAYWRVHRPPPGYMNPVDHPLTRHFSATQIQRRMAKGRDRQQQLHQKHQLHQQQLQQQQQQQEGPLSSSHKSVDTILMSYELTKAFDWFLLTTAAAAAGGGGGAASSSEAAAAGSDEPGPSPQVGAGGVGGGSPWLLEDPGGFQACQGTGESGLTPKQVKLWGTSFDFLLRDAAGREYFRHFLTKEFSSENLRFWLAVQDYKFGPGSQLQARMDSLFAEFLAPGAPSEINIDSRTMTATQRGMQSPGRFTFEEAQEHIYLLMKKDSYQRFLRSEDYKGLLLASADRHARKKAAAAAAAFSFAKRPGGGNAGSKARADTGSSADTSSSGSRPVRSNPVVVVQLQQLPQAVAVAGDGGGPSRGFDGRGGTVDEVTPWETPTGGDPDNAVTPWETTTGGDPENAVAPWESAERAKIPVTPEVAGKPSSPAVPAELADKPDNPVTPWETADKPENPATDKPENPVTPWE